MEREFKGYGGGKVVISGDNLYIKQMFIKENCTKKDLKSVIFNEPSGMKNGNIQIRTQKQTHTIFFLKEDLNKFKELYKLLNEVNSDGQYDFSIITGSEDADIKKILNYVKKAYEKKLYPLGLIEETSGVINKPAYVLNGIIIELFKNSMEPFAFLAVGMAYSRKGAYFRGESIRYLQSYIDNYVPCPVDSFYLSKKNIINTLAELYKKEYDYQSAYDCLSNYIEEGNKPEIRELLLLGELLEKIDINKCVDYFSRLKSTPFYNNENSDFIDRCLEDAIDKQEKNYKYRPRKNHKKPYDEKIEEDILKQATRYADYFLSM